MNPFDLYQVRVLIKRLISKEKADVSTRFYLDSTALHFACGGGNLAMVKLLVKNKADINAKDVYGVTPFHTAVCRKELEICEYLIKNGADINCLNTNKISPLHFAISYSEPNEMIGSNVDTRDYELAEESSFELVKMLIKNGAIINVLCENNITPLYEAVMSGFLQVAKYLIDNGASVNLKTSSNLTPLHLAAKKGNLNMVELLLEHGADVNGAQPNFFTPLHVAINESHNDIATILIKYEANLNAQDHYGICPLHLAVLRENFDIVKDLIKNGANINLKLEMGITPLHFAAENGYLNIVKLLVLNGAFFDAKAEGSVSTPIEFTKRSISLLSSLIRMPDFIETINFLKLLKKLFIAIKENKLEEVRKCIKEGTIVDTMSIQYKTPLILASWKGNAKIVNLLLKNHAKINLTCDKGYSALHYAVNYNHIFIAYMLLQNGAMFDLETIKGKYTPLDFARKSDNKEIGWLLYRIDGLFKSAKNGDQSIVTIIEGIKNKNRTEFLAVTNACNNLGNTLLKTAMLSNNQIIVHSIYKLLQED